jgi:transposase
MEYTAKIIQQQWVMDKQVWKYEFVDIQTNQQDFFYHDKQVDYKPDIAGKLTLTTDKFFQSFNQEIIESGEQIKKDEILTELEGEVKHGTENFLNDFPKKRIKLSLGIEQLHSLHNKGYTWKEVAKIYEKHEQSIYYWLRTKDKVLQKRGAKPKFDEKILKLLLDHNEMNNTATQQERADYVSRQIVQKISQQTVSLLLKKLGITRKKLTFHYTQLNKERAKAFNEEIKPLLLNNVPFIALDECSFYPNQDPRFGYSFEGSRAIARKPSHKGKHYTLLFAISNLKVNGVVH